MAAHPDIVKLCRAILKRQDALKLKGRKAEEAAFEFAIGYYAGLESADERKADRLTAWLVDLVLSTRGLAEVRRVVDEAEEEGVA